MENKQIKVIVKRPNSKAKEMTIVDKLKTYQELVEGYIEVIPFPKDDPMFHCQTGLPRLSVTFLTTSPIYNHLIQRLSLYMHPCQIF